MDVVVRKYQQKFKKARDEMDRWDQLQSNLIIHFKNASTIIEGLEVLQDPKNHGELKSIPTFKEAILGHQMMSLQKVLGSIKATMEEFQGIVTSLNKLIRDGRQLVEGGGRQPSQNQMNLRIGIRPSIADCLEGLRLIHEMHHDEYQLKLSIVSKLMSHKQPRANGVRHLLQLLVDQPNIPKDEVKSIFDIIFAEEIC